MSERVLFVNKKNAQITLVHRYFQLSIINAKDRYQIISQVYHIFRMIFNYVKCCFTKIKSINGYIENIYDKVCDEFRDGIFFLTKCE